MNPRDPESDEPAIDGFDWRKINDLAELGQYGLVAETLHEARLACDQPSEVVLSGVLEAAYQICRSCEQVHAEQVWHLQIAEDSQRREERLRYQLQTFFGLFDSAIPPPNVAGEEQSDLPTTLPPERIGIEAAPKAPDTRPERSLSSALPTLHVHCLGGFRVFEDDEPIEEWASNKGKSVFKYLIANRPRPVAKEVLMEMFWPNVEPEAARNNLNVAIYGLRRSFLGDHPYILFRDDQYLINPDMEVWVDAEQFLEHDRRAQNLEQQGRIDSALAENRLAAAFYQGEYMEEDRYEEWPLPHRERLHQSFLRLLDRLGHHHFSQKDYDSCAVVCNRIVAVDACHEAAHRRLMRCYSRLGQRYLAVRQYHRCVEALSAELEVNPSQRTVDLFEHIQRDMPI